MISKERALDILHQNIKNNNLRKHHYGVAAAMKNRSWGVWVRQERAELLAEVDRQKWTTFIWLLAGFLGAVIGAYALARHVGRPLQHLAGGAEEVSRGNFLARIPMEGGPDLRRVADTFNRMVERLKEYDDA